MSGERALLAEWRNALRDSELGVTPKLVGFVLSTYFTGDGRTGHDAAHPSPAKTTLARGAGLSARYKGNRAVDAAIDALEAAGFLLVDRRRGARGFGYHAVIPHDAAGYNPHEDAGSNGSESRTVRHLNPARDDHGIPHGGAGESESESEKNAFTRASRAGGKRRRANAPTETDLSYLDE